MHIFSLKNDIQSNPLLTKSSGLMKMFAKSGRSLNSFQGEINQYIKIYQNGNDEIDIAYIYL